MTIHSRALDSATIDQQIGVTDLSEDRIRQLIDYFEGHGSHANRSNIEAWISAEPERIRRIKRLRLAWIVAGETKPVRVESESMWQVVSYTTQNMYRNEVAPLKRNTIPSVAPKIDEVLARKRATAQHSTHVPVVDTQRVRHYVRWFVVACVTGFLVVMGGYAWNRYGYMSLPMETVREVVTAQGQRTSLQLNDGTQITLGVASRLMIPTDFGTRNRTIVLNGEALISVTPDPERPFVVRTSTAAVRVLGTSFVVRQYADETGATVSVQSGKVLFQDTVVSAGQQGRWDGQKSVVVSVMRDEQATIWVDGRLVFDHTPLREVIGELNRWYSTRFVVDDPTLGDEIVTAEFTNLSAEEVANTLDRMLRIRHRRIATYILLSR